MIVGAHMIVYSHDAEADRAFIRDVLGFASIDAGDGWLIFKLPPAEIAVHPTNAETKHEIYLLCDDIARLLADFGDRGIKCSPVNDQGWGLVASIKLPSGADLALYEPRHPVAYDLDR